MKRNYLLAIFFISILSTQAQQWAGPNNTTSTISRTGNIETHGITIKAGSSPGVNLVRDDNNINNGAVISQINFRSSDRFGGLIVARAVGAWGADTDQAGTKIEFWTQDNTTNGNLGTRMVIDHDGKVGIGTQTMGSHQLAVEGSIGAREVKVEIGEWSDFVFENGYGLRTLEQVENFINKNKHLPEIPSAEDVAKNGVNLGEMDAKLLQKIEELTLYVIDINKRVNQLELENKNLKTEVSNLKIK